ncbi:MAG: hypothetical protein SGI92_12415 [Bryobacteraceae bacterium]|nr:hypothetical protein [Bryobacteraceae bacterium]
MSRARNGRFRNVEWYAQDNWRVGRRLTMDVGVLFYQIVPTWVAGQKLGYFSADDYKAADAPPLLRVR